MLQTGGSTLSCSLYPGDLLVVPTISRAPGDLTDLCTVLYGWTEHAWDKLLQDSLVDLPPSEDQLTQELLSTLKHRFGHLTAAWWQRRYEGSGEGGETKPNADWEWWFGDATGWTGMRVQAKKMDSATGRYPDLNNDSGKKRQQADWLIANALAAPGQPAPFYCFFNAWPDDAPVASFVKTSSLRRDYGATLVPAPAVRAALDRRVRSLKRGASILGFDDFDGLHAPLAVPFCQGQEDSVRRSLAEFIEATWGVADEGGAADDIPRPSTAPVPATELAAEVQLVLRAANPDPDIAGPARERLSAVTQPQAGAIAAVAQDRDTLMTAINAVSAPPPGA